MPDLNQNGPNGRDQNGDGSGVSDVTREEIERGLQFANIMNTVNLDQNKETIASLQALTQVLIKSGVIQAKDLAAALEVSRKRVASHPMPAVRIANSEDKYSATQNVQIDCADLIPLCHARCCTFKFYLTKQDLDEGVARWDYGNPYWIKQRPDGYCTHLDGDTKTCAIHAKRPHVCRAYDCRKDKRVWIDFEKRIPAPMPEPSGTAPVAMAEVMLQQTEATTKEDKDNLTKPE